MEDLGVDFVCDRKQKKQKDKQKTFSYLHFISIKIIVSKIKVIGLEMIEKLRIVPNS